MWYGRRLRSYRNGSGSVRLNARCPRSAGGQGRGLVYGGARYDAQNSRLLAFLWIKALGPAFSLELWSWRARHSGRNLVTMGTADDCFAAITAKAHEEPLELVTAERACVFINRHESIPAKGMPELRSYKNRARIGSGEVVSVSHPFSDDSQANSTQNACLDGSSRNACYFSP